MTKMSWCILRYEKRRLSHSFTQHFPSLSRFPFQTSFWLQKHISSEFNAFLQPTWTPYLFCEQSFSWTCLLSPKAHIHYPHQCLFQLISNVEPTPAELEVMWCIFWTWLVCFFNLQAVHFLNMIKCGRCWAGQTPAISIFHLCKYNVI